MYPGELSTSFRLFSSLSGESEEKPHPAPRGSWIPGEPRGQRQRGQTGLRSSKGSTRNPCPKESEKSWGDYPGREKLKRTVEVLGCALQYKSWRFFTVASGSVPRYTPVLSPSAVASSLARSLQEPTVGPKTIQTARIPGGAKTCLR